MYKNLSISLCFILLFTIVANNAMAAQSPLGWWKFDESTAGVTGDASGNGYDGTVTGATIVSDPERGMVMNFTGAGYISLPPELFELIGDEVTICLWQNGNAAVQPHADCIFEGFNSGNARTLNSHIPWSSGSIFWDAGYSDSSYDRINKAADSANQYEGKWNHWAFTKDNAAGEMKIYLNGQLWLSGSGKTKSMADVTMFKIGSGAGGTGNFYNGMMDDFRIYDKALTQNEITEIIGVNTAQGQNPDGQTGLDVELVLSWTAAYSESRTFNVYYGKNSNDVRDSQPGALLGDTVLAVGYGSTSLAQTFDPASTYYWRVDVIDGNTVYADEVVHTFSTAAVNSYNFQPANGQGGLNPLTTVLRWSAGLTTVSGYNVYLGTDQTAVTNGTDGTKVAALQTQTSYTPNPTPAENTTYYWRIEDVGTSTVSSAVMSFATAKNVEQGLLGWWKFDESAAGVTPDSSGNERNGTLVGDCQLVTDAERGTVLDINSTDNSYVNCGGGGTGDWSDQRTVSVCAWVKIDQFEAGEQYIASNGTSYMIGRYGLTDHLRFWTDGFGAHDNQLEGKANIQDGRWHFVVFTYDRAIGSRYLYVDCKIDAAGSYVVDLAKTADGFIIGGYLGNPNSCWKGLIDDVRLYNIALTQCQIRNLYGGPVALNPVPADETGNLNIKTILSWQPADIARQTNGQDLYFGTDWYQVRDGVAGVHIGLQSGNSYDPCGLESGRTYYWRVDQIDDANQIHTGYIWSFRTETQGYYMDMYKDSGVQINRCTEMPAANVLALSFERLSVYNNAPDQAIQDSVVIGNANDDNGYYLYPDFEPRFRGIYCAGGGATSHGKSYGDVGRQHMRDFVNHGGSYSGSCAGAYITASSSYYYHIWPGHTGGGLGIYKTNYKIPADSPLLKYYDFAGGPEGDLEILDVQHWGGPYVDPCNPGHWLEGTVALALFDGPKTDVISDKCVSIWGYKANDQAGTVAPIGSHPERVPTGKQRDLMAGVLLYMMDGNGDQTVKAALQKGIMRVMDDNANFGHEKIGDKQYHHFTIEILPSDHNDIKIDLIGDGQHDLNLYARFGDFAFQGEDGVIEATNDSNSSETLVIKNPQSGTWYIGVKGVETVERTLVWWGWEYTGNLEVLNGVAYAIGVNTNGDLPLEGDVNHDGNVNTIDLKTMATEWLDNNNQLIPRGNLLGLWNFDNFDANDSSSNGHNGILAGDANIVTDPNMGEVLELDGDGDYVDLGNGGWTNPGNHMTVAAWIKVLNFDASFQTIIAKGLYTYRLGRAGSGNNLQIYMDYTANHNYQSAAGTTNVNDNQWHHAAVTYNGTTMKLYIDGQQEGSSALSTLNTNTSPLMIGRNSDSTGRDWQGRIDDVRLYDYALELSDIQKIFEGFELLEGYQCIDRPASDLNGDCLVNFADFVILASNWLK